MSSSISIGGMVENNWGKSLAPSSFRHFIDQDSINHQVSQLRDVLWKYRGGKLSTDDDNKIKGIRERLNAHAQAHRELKDASSDARNAVSNLENLEEIIFVSIQNQHQTL